MPAPQVISASRPASQLSSTDPSVPPKDGRSLLLELPDELQSDIYQRVFGSYDLTARLLFGNREGMGPHEWPHERNRNESIGELDEEYASFTGPPTALRNSILYVNKRIFKVAFEAREKMFSGTLVIRHSDIGLTNKVSDVSEELKILCAKHAEIVSRINTVRFEQLGSWAWMWARVSAHNANFIEAAKVFPKLNTIELKYDILHGFNTSENTLQARDEQAYQAMFEAGKRDKSLLDIASPHPAPRCVASLERETKTVIKVYMELWFESYLDEELGQLLRLRVTDETIRVV